MPVKIIPAILDLFFPARCVFCRRPLSYDTPRLCCKSCVPSTNPPVPLKTDIPGGICHYALPYTGEVRRAILAFKFYGMAQYDRLLAEFLSPVVRSLGGAECITWAPVSAVRLQKRGYDQSRLLAEAVGRELGLPVRRLLYKRRHTRRQSLVASSGRAKNVRGAYTAAPHGFTPGAIVILIDDIVTTGSTLAECRRVLLESGAGEVLCVALAH